MPDTPRISRVADLLQAARELPPAERGCFLDEHCGPDAALRDEIDSLLAEADADPGFMAEPLGGSCGSAAALVAGIGATRAGGNGAHANGSATAAAAALPDIEGFQVLREVGSGGMGVVYEARQLRPPRRVAIKALRRALPTPREVARFELEMDVLAGLDHRGIARFYQRGEFAVAGRAQPFLVMEYVAGTPIDRAVRERRPGVRETVRLMLEVCEAVASAHRRGVVHRDLKPGNVLVTEDEGEIKLVDFGVARLLDAAADAGRPRLTVDGTLLGTPAYMSPEQAEGRDDLVELRSDVYALGAVLYELLAGKPPLDLEGLTRAEATRAIATTEPPPLRSLRRGVPRDLAAVVAKAMSKRRAARYVDAGALADDLRRFLEHRPVAARRAWLPARATKFARRHWVGLGVTAVLAAAAAVVALPYVRTQAFTLTVNPRNAIEVELQWDDAYRGESRYVIEWLAGDRWNDLMDVPGNATTAKVGGLEPGRVYNYRVRAEGPLGLLGYSRVASVVMPSAQWHSPGRFRVRLVEPTRIGLAWSARPQDVGYRVRIADASRVWLDLADLMPGTDAFEIRALKPGTAYSVQVGAVVPNGRTLWSLPLKVETPRSPGDPVEKPKAPTGPRHNEVEVR